MRFSIFNVFIMTIWSSNLVSFKDKQMKNERVHVAFHDKYLMVTEALAIKNITVGHLEVFIRIFKQEKELQVWVKRHEDTSFQYLKSFEICASSGLPGPKRKNRDLQTPEGFYCIDRFNPLSNYYLSLGVNYPNASDQVLAVKGNAGGIFLFTGIVSPSVVFH